VYAPRVFSSWSDIPIDEIPFRPSSSLSINPISFVFLPFLCS
jgi:hypothetical protein